MLGIVILKVYAFARFMRALYTPRGKQVTYLDADMAFVGAKPGCCRPERHIGPSTCICFPEDVVQVNEADRERSILS